MSSCTCGTRILGRWSQERFGDKIWNKLTCGRCGTILKMTIMDSHGKLTEEIMMSSTTQKIAIMQAFANGKTIQVLPKGKTEWEWASMPCWDWYRSEYRIKPEPLREYWITVCDEAQPNVYYNTTAAELNCERSSLNRKVVHVREVREDD